MTEEKSHYDWVAENIRNQHKKVVDQLKRLGYTIVGFNEEYEYIPLRIIYHYGEFQSKYTKGDVNIQIANCIAIRTEKNGSINAIVENFDGTGKKYFTEHPIPRENWFLLYCKDTKNWFNKGKEDFSLESYERWENTKYLLTHVNEIFNEKEPKDKPKEKPMTQKEVEEGLREMGVWEDDE